MEDGYVRLCTRGIYYSGDDLHDAYDESFHCGEEPEFCLRALHKGYRV